MRIHDGEMRERRRISTYPASQVVAKIAEISASHGSPVGNDPAALEATDKLVNKLAESRSTSSPGTIDALQNNDRRPLTQHQPSKL
jgi:hypothetical protein